MSTLFGSSAANANNTVGDLKGDVAVANPPDDSISDLSFNPSPNDPKDFMAVASWDKKIRIYEVNTSTGQTDGRLMYEHNAPVFSCHFAKDGKRVVSAGADNQARLCDLESGKNEVVAQHDQPIRTVKFFDVDAAAGGQQMIVTGSWDKTVKYWDLRQQQPVATVQCQERVYTMDVKDNLLVVGTADRYINVINLKEPTKLYKTLQSPLKWQTRVVTCFNDSAGFAIGSIEGRCAMQYVEDKDASSNFSFRCHREPPPPGSTVTHVYAVNDISFNPVHGTFSTAGSDGTFHFWDKDAKHRLKGYPSVGGSITTAKFNRDGKVFVYAVSYDWSKGYQGNSPQYPTKIMLHPVLADECKPRPAVKKR
ncbi:nuclear pore complex protein [Niveomyces insectorum RCEF 264]|uniref:Nuclear pore complex protein n=1 Tax=Niveomyces insectorum RCEF 264 TaxID=1081102 RepID=A0A167YS83_9HYPO|nr:nuclear pore complex protein [Niveomyces insectorum RCEF 264]